MTDLQRRQIRELRMKGVGYRAIAAVLGLSRDSVRSFCKNAHLEGLAKELKANMKEKTANGQVCLCCGKQLKQPASGRRRKFCSDECRRRWWGEHVSCIDRRATAYYEATCIYCGKTFKAYGNNHRRYCSQECYVRDRFWRKEEGREPYVGPGERMVRNDDGIRNSDAVEDTAYRNIEAGGIQSEEEASKG